MPSDTTASQARPNGPTLLDAHGDEIHQAASQAQAMGDQVVEAVRRQPLTAALVIFGIGYVLGKIT